MRLPGLSLRSFRPLFYALLVGGGVALGLYLNSSPPSEDQLKETIITSLQEEADTTVFITGHLTISARLTLEETRHFPRSDELPWYTVPFFHAAGSPQINLGTNRTALNVPGRVSYGFSIDGLTADNVEIIDERTIRLALPPLEVYSVEPRLKQLALETERGWARWASSGRQLEQRALGDINESLRSQARRHLEQSDQPALNTIRSVQKLLQPVLNAAGIEDPRFEFHTPSMHISLSPENGSSTGEHQ